MRNWAFVAMISVVEASPSAHRNDGVDDRRDDFVVDATRQRATLRGPCSPLQIDLTPH
jgi:hypothetical protein